MSSPGTDAWRAGTSATVVADESFGSDRCAVQAENENETRTTVASNCRETRFHIMIGFILRVLLAEGDAPQAGVRDIWGLRGSSEGWGNAGRCPRYGEKLDRIILAISHEQRQERPAGG